MLVFPTTKTREARPSFLGSHQLNFFRILTVLGNFALAYELAVPNTARKVETKANGSSRLDQVELHTQIPSRFQICDHNIYYSECCCAESSKEEHGVALQSSSLLRASSQMRQRFIILSPKVGEYRRGWTWSCQIPPIRRIAISGGAGTHHHHQTSFHPLPCKVERQ